MLTRFHNNRQQQWTKWSVCVFPAKAGDTNIVNHFWQSVDAILEDVSVTETIVWR